MEIRLIGFPKVGGLRELKFIIEQYFRKKIDEKQLLKQDKLLVDVYSPSVPRVDELKKISKNIGQAPHKSDMV